MADTTDKVIKANITPEQELTRLLQAAFGEDGRNEFIGFIGLTEKLKQKQDELDIMARDTMVAAILSDYLSDVLLPNSNGDLISIVPKDLKAQSLFDSIYDRLNLPLDKIVYSLLTKAVAIAEFEQASITTVAEKTIKERSATESLEERHSDPETELKYSMAKEVIFPQSEEVPAQEQILIRKPGTILPRISLIHDTYTVFPIIKYERCVGYIRVKKEVIESSDFNWMSDVISYQDVIIHPATDYVHVVYGVRHSSQPIRFTVREADGTQLVYEVETGCSMLEDSYSAWKTLVLLQDSVVLASLIKNAQIMLVETEAGNASEGQIEVAKLRLRQLFEGQLALGSNGLRSYLNPQAKPAYIYSFTNNGVGKISASVIGGEYNPGQLYYLTPFVNQFFSGMNYPKQRAGFTEGAGGLDGGGAVEEYTKRYLSTVMRLKRLLASFIKKCINNVLISKNLYKHVDEFDVTVYGAYSEESLYEVQFQQTKLQLFESLISFTGIEDPAKQRELRSLLIKQIISTPAITEAIDELLLEELSPQPAESEQTDLIAPDTQIPDDLLGDLGLEDLPPEQGPDLPTEQSAPLDTPEQLPDMGDTLSNTGE